MGTARPTSTWPRAVSTLGRLKRLKSDIFEGAFSSLGALDFWSLGALDFSGLGTLGFGETARRIEPDRPVDDEDLESEADSRRLVDDRPNRHREMGGNSGPRAGALLLVRYLSEGASYVAT